MTEHLNLGPYIQTLKLDLEQNLNNIYIHPPSKVTDDAWNLLERGVASWATSHDLAAAGIEPSQSVKLPQSMGYGDDAYPIVVDVKHQIHCLNRLRKDIHFEHYYGADFEDANVTAFHQLHTNHCILVLLESLMCDATTDFDAFSWFKHFPHSMADFNINRKCGDFEAIDRWANERRLDQKELFNLPKPTDAYERPMSDRVRQTLAQYDSHGTGGDIN